MTDGVYIDGIEGYANTNETNAVFLGTVIT